MTIDEQAIEMLNHVEIADEDRAVWLQALRDGEMLPITDGDEVVGLLIPIVDQDPGDEDS